MGQLLAYYRTQSLTPFYYRKNLDLIMRIQTAVVANPGSVAKSGVGAPPLDLR